MSTRSLLRQWLVGVGIGLLAGTIVALVFGVLDVRLYIALAAVSLVGSAYGIYQRRRR